ncbi:MAG TPA: cell division protein FtsA [Candidatus Omnitrophica bacterium]|nr:cell division protein FtsA [Candidatus Omnitrophota bacterium]
MKKNPKRYLYALDIGSKKLALAAGGINKDNTLSPVYIETFPSKGIFKGVVNDLAAMSDSVQQIFKKMSTRTHEIAAETALSINGNYINTRNSIAAMAVSERGTRSITKRDMDKLNAQARTLGLELDEHLLHEYPQGYSVDRHNMTLNPLGLHGRRFEMDLLLISAHAGYIENITKAVEQAGLDVTDVVFSAVAASEGVLSEEDKDKGVVLVDIGDTLTGVLIFKDGVVRRARVIPFGGRNITEIISNFYKIPPDLADSMKESSLEIEHGISDTEEVMIKSEYEFKAVKKKELASIVVPEIDNFIAMLKGLIFESGVPGISGCNIVVTGGFSLLEGLLEKMEIDLGLPVKMGKPNGLPDLPISKVPAYTGAIGLLYLQRRSRATIGANLQAQGKNKLARTLDYITTLYQDYF